MKHVVRAVAHWALLAHIYISMAGLTLAVLFGATGLALNHQDWGFSNPRITTSEISLDKGVVAHADQATIERYLREQLRLRSASTDFHDDTDQIQVTYAAPGARTIVTIDRKNGKAQVEKESRGFLGRLGDLHKGLDSGSVWYWTIDFAALLIVVSSLTGIMTLLSLRHRRRMGFTIGALGVLTILVIYVLWVPK
ncbi:MAG TPA: PepSY-associated TM helix domain-containing protein [Vicinamibacterales bacterium]|nr:PepSY-associated TM helix domain-containing protein [Vicinamibacterales bacterium]